MSSELQERSQKLDESSLDILFRSARTGFAWQDKPVPESIIHELYDLLRLGPTSANLNPRRFVFVTSPEAKERLLPTLAPGNVEKTKTAPVTVIVAFDTAFFERNPHLFPHFDFRPHFDGKPEPAKHFAEQNTNLQAAYLILAARALGLAAGPMGGFNKEAVDAEFFPDGRWKSVMLVNLGYPDLSTVTPRLPRLPFDEAALIL